jgi:hypothetical protein
MFVDSESVNFINADPSTELCRIDSDGAVFVNGEPATDAEFMVALRKFQREQDAMLTAEEAR